jgi:hypothetical protein
MVKFFRKKTKKNKKTAKNREVETNLPRLNTEATGHIGMDDDEIIFEEQQTDSQGKRIAQEIKLAAKVLENELKFEIDDDRAKKFQTISLYSYSDEEEDDSLESELQDLVSSQLLLQTELGKVGYDGESDSKSSDDMVAQHVIDDDLYPAIHDQLPLVDEYKADMRHGKSTYAYSRPDPPQEGRPLVTPDPEDDLSERYARTSQLPSAEEMKATPYVNSYPEDPLTTSERQARISQLPSTNEIRARLKQENSRRLPSLLRFGFLLCILMVLVIPAIVLPIVLIEGGKPRVEDVIDFLSKNDISKLGDLKNPGTPQYRAARWIADEDLQRVPISMKRSFLDRYVLAVLFYALGGDKTWPSDLDFLSPTHVCQWVQSTSNQLGNDLTAGVHGCKTIDGELVPIGIALGK